MMNLEKINKSHTLIKGVKNEGDKDESKSENKETSLESVIVNLPRDKSGEIVNFLSKRGVALADINIKSVNNAIMEFDTLEDINKLEQIMSTSSGVINSSNDLLLFGGKQQKIREYMNQQSVVTNVYMIKNIKFETDAETILNLLPNRDIVKKFSFLKKRRGATNSKTLRLELIDDYDGNIISLLNNKIIDGNKLIVENQFVKDCPSSTPVISNEANTTKPTSTLLISNFPSDINYEKLKEIDLPFIDCRIIRKGAKRMGILKFQNEAAGEIAFNHLNGKEFENNILQAKYLEKREPTEEDKDVDMKVLHVTNLPYTLNQKDVETEFDMADEVKLIVNNQERSKGCCYLKFKAEEMAQLALENLADKILCGRKLRIRYAPSKFLKAMSEKSEKNAKKRKMEPKKQKSKDHVLTLFNLPKDVDRAEIRKYFEGVQMIHIVEKDKVFKGIAEVHFYSPELASEAMKVPMFTMKGRPIRKELKGGKWRDHSAKVVDKTEDSDADNDNEMDSD